MPELGRIACSNCKQSIYNVMIAGPDGQPHRVPLVVRINVGQPDDTGVLDVNGDQIRMPSFVREMQHTPLARLELCVACFAAIFNLPLVTWAEDPLALPLAEYRAMLQSLGVEDPAAADKSERFRRMHARALASFAIGWDTKTLADLPQEFRPDVQPAPEAIPPSP